MAASQPPMTNMDRKDFEQIALKAVSQLPKEYGRRLENVEIIIEDKPDMDTAKKFNLGTHGRLLGLYQGVPLKARTHYYGMVLPDRVILYQANIERTCREEGMGIFEEVKHVLQHEIAHHFGITDERLKDIGAY